MIGDDGHVTIMGRAGGNPATGEPVTVPPKSIAFFKPSKEVLELINRRGPS